MLACSVLRHGIVCSILTPLLQQQELAEEQGRDSGDIFSLQSPSEGDLGISGQVRGVCRGCPCSLNTQADERQERRKMASDNRLCWHKNKEV